MKFCVVKIIQGGAVAAPVGGQILADVLPYLELKKDNEQEEETIEEIEVPEIRGLNLQQAKKKLQEVGLEITVNREIEEGEKEEDITVKEQIPKPRN